MAVLEISLSANISNSHVSIGTHKGFFNSDSQPFFKATLI